MAVQTQFQFRRGTAAQWTSANPILAAGEFGYEADTGKGKIGNGATAWTSLPYVIGAFDANQLTGTTLAPTVVSSALTSVGTLGALGVTGAIQAGSINVTGNVIYNIATNAQGGTTYTLAQTDAGKIVELSNSSGCTVTIPTNASVPLAVGTQINLLQTSSGQVTVAAAGGVTVNANPGLKLRAQWGFATLIKRSSDLWVLVGDLTA
jgi:hypothetical protein